MPQLDLPELSNNDSDACGGPPPVSPRVEGAPGLKAVASYASSPRAPSSILAAIRGDLDSVQKEIESLESLLATARKRRDALYAAALLQNLGPATAETGEPRSGSESGSGLGGLRRKSRLPTTERDDLSSRSRDAISIMSIRSAAAACVYRTPAHTSPEDEDSGAPTAVQMDIDSDTPSSLELRDDGSSGEDADMEFGSDGPSEGSAPQLPTSSSSAMSVSVAAPGQVPGGTPRPGVSSVGGRGRTSICESIRNLRLNVDGFACAPDSPRLFLRTQISSALGGGTRSTFPAPDVSRQRHYRIPSEYYICVKRTLNRWLPRKPGERGGLAVFNDKARHNHVYPLFVATQQKKWMYMGNYRALNLPANNGFLSLGDWRRNFCREQKLRWAAHIISREWARKILLDRGVITKGQFAMRRRLRDSLSPEELVAYFEREDDDLPCLRIQLRLLEPDSYDRALYDALVASEPGPDDSAAEDADGELEEDRDQAEHGGDGDGSGDARSDTAPQHRRLRKPRSAGGLPHPPSPWQALTPQTPRARAAGEKKILGWAELDSGDEDALQRYRPAVLEAGRVKRERADSSGSDLSSRPAARLRMSSRSQSVEAVAPWLL